MAITHDQCRAARALLNWTQLQLAEAAGVAKKTIADFETGKRTPLERTVTDVQKALENGGIEFIPKNERGAGVRFREREQLP